MLDWVKNADFLLLVFSVINPFLHQSLFNFLALIAAETVQKMNKVEMRARASSFIETIRTRSSTITSREDVTDTASMTSSMTSNTNTRERSPLLTPQYLNTDMMTSDQFNYDLDHVSIRSGSTRYDFKHREEKVLRKNQGFLYLISIVTAYFEPA